MFLQKFYCLMIATLLLLGLNIQNVLATDCDILINALTTFSSALKSSIESTTDCCQFTGVTCNLQNQITSLNFSKVKNYSMNIEQFFAELAKLKQLSTLELTHITGTIGSGFPSNIGDLKQLKNLIINNSSSFMGFSEIPESLGNLTNLEKLDLSENSIKGSIPSSLGNLTKLTYINLNGNNLEGYIPYEFKHLNNLEELHLNNNSKLKGYVPLLSAIKTCDYEMTQLCYFINSKCKSGNNVCVAKDIQETNAENGNPNPNSTEVTDSSSSYSSSKIKVNGSALRSVIYVILFNFILFGACCILCIRCCCGKSQPKFKLPIQTSVTTNNVTNNNSTTSAPYPAADNNVSSITVTPSSAPYPAANANVSTVAPVTPSPYLAAPYPAANNSSTSPVVTPAPVSSTTPVVAPAYNYNTNLTIPMPAYNPAVGTYPPPADPNVSAVYNPPIPPADPNVSAVYNPPIPPANPNVSAVYNPPIPPTDPNASVVYNPYYPPPMGYPANTSYQVVNPPYGVPTPDPNASYVAPAPGASTSVPVAPVAPTAPTAPTGTSTSEKSGNPYENVATTLEVVPPYSAVANPQETIPTTAPQAANGPYDMAPQAPNAPYGV